LNSELQNVNAFDINQKSNKTTAYILLQMKQI